MPNFVAQLVERLNYPLPGLAALRPFAPDLSYGRHAGPASVGRRDAAVLVLLFPSEDQWRLPLMLRPPHMTDHAGQVSLPGGLIEPGETVEACAVREFIEELGPSSQDVRVLGRLTPIFIYGSNFRVTPCVAVADEPLEFQPRAEEVAELLTLSTAELQTAPENDWHWRERRGVAYRAPHLLCGGHRVWGATWLMLAELKMILASNP